MLYPYECTHCGAYAEIVKSAKQATDKEICLSCKSELTRKFTSFHFSGSKNYWAEYNPAFGKIIKKKSDLKEECKIRNCVEVGNYDKDSYAKEMDTKLEKIANRDYENDYWK